MIHASDLVLDLIIAAVLGGAVGVQRQAAQKPAGFRTHLLVALASCAFAEVGRLSGDDRITANVLQGIGFLGAGAIFRSGFTAHGLTTAASIWTVAAIGVAVGYGHPYSMTIGVGVTFITVLVLSVSDSFFSRIFAHKATLKVVCIGHAVAKTVYDMLERDGVRYQVVGEFRLAQSPEGVVHEIEFDLSLPRNAHLRQLVTRLSDLPGVRSASSYVAVESS
ncbi:MAG: MgtC/SapB family protein [Candidatus Eremiobacteraeota bacterium]|nr:MgtC/SapB family protein [Candidatus Eremiobacteraeota bacterium]